MSAGGGTRGSGALRRAFLELRTESSRWPPGSFKCHLTFLCVSYLSVHTAPSKVLPCAQSCPLPRPLVTWASVFLVRTASFGGGVGRTGALGSSLGFLLLPLLSTRLSACYLRFIDFLSHGYFSVFLGKIKDAFDRNPGLQNLLLDDFFKSAVENCQVCSPELGGTGIPSLGFALRGICSCTHT